MSHFTVLARAFVAAAALAIPARSPAQQILPPEAMQVVSDTGIRITLLTMGQGTEVYELFGHNAIWVHDPAQPFDIVYNWGVFDFRTPGFLGRFLLGDMRYMMAGETFDNTVAIYSYLNRDVYAQELNLTPAEKRALVDYVRWNALPQNAQYRYDYYLDNCSTRARDAIDRVLGGQLRAYLKGIPTGETYRSHSLRLMQGDPLLVTGVEMALGRPTDFTLSADQASFLPVQLMQYLRSFKLDGGARPLVAREYMINRATRAPEASKAPALWKGLLPIGLLLAALLWLLGTRPARRLWIAIGIAIVAGLFGLVGLVITLLVTITDHVAAHANENMFMLNPIWLVVAVAFALATRGRARGVLRWAALAGAAVSVLAVLIHVVGLSRQPNWDIIGLVLPAELVIAWLATRQWPVTAAGSLKNST